MRSLINRFLRFSARCVPFGKLGYKYRLFAMKYVRGTVITRDSLGNRLLLNLDRFMDSYVYIYGIFEGPSVEFLRSAAQRLACRRFIDVGADFGIYSLTQAGISSIERCDAFEPDPQNYSQLLANVFLNERHDKIHCHPLALSDRDGSAAFFVSRHTARGDARKMNTGTSSFTFNPVRHREQDRVTVQLKRLDDLITCTGERIAIKIDVEGHESQVLHGMEKLLRQNDCIVLFEVLDESLSVLDAYLSSLDYQQTFSHAQDRNFGYMKRSLI